MYSMVSWKGPVKNQVSCFTVASWY